MAVAKSRFHSSSLEAEGSRAAAQQRQSSDHDESCVAYGHRLPPCPDASCSVRSRIANCSARIAVTTNGITKGTTYTYLPYVDGSLGQLTYPSGRTITYTYDSAGRPSLAQDVANSLDYVEGTCANGTSTQGVCYGPQGALASLIEGESSSFAGFNMSYVYNTRLQPCWMFATTGAALPASATCATTDPGPATILDLQYNFKHPFMSES